MFGHPLGTGQVTLESAARAVWFFGRIDTEHDARDFRPVRSFSLCVQKTQIGGEMLVIIIGERIRLGDQVGNWRINWNVALGHVRLCPTWGGFGQ